MAGLTESQKENGQRLFVIDLRFASLPKRIAVLVDPGDTVRHIAVKMQCSHLCSADRYRCTMEQGDATNTRTWNYFDVIEEPHASHFQFLFSPIQRVCAHDQEDEVAAFMQRSVRQAMVDSTLKTYIRQFTSSRLEVTFWLHSQGFDEVQPHPSRCDLQLQADVDSSAQECWVLGGLPALSRVTPVDPAPVLLVLPRPHVIVSSTFDPFEIPVLCKLIQDGRMNLVSTLINGRYPPIGVSAIFELTLPANLCQVDSECYVLYGAERFEYWHDIPLQPGAFICLYEWRQQQSEDGSTECSSCSSDFDTHTWIDGFDDEGGDPGERAVLEHVGDNTATPSDTGSPIVVNRNVASRREGANTATPLTGEEEPDDAFVAIQSCVVHRCSHTLERLKENTQHQSEEFDEQSLFQMYIHGRTLALGQGQEPVLYPETFRQEVQRRLLWDLHVRRIARLTSFYQYDYMAAEAAAFRTARGQWPDVVMCGLIREVVSFWDMAFDEHFEYSLAELQAVLRGFIEPPLLRTEKVVMAAVKPLPTVDEQQGEDNLYVLIGVDLDWHEESLVLVAIWDFRGEVAIDLHPLVVPPRMESHVLLEILGLAARCEQAFIRCTVTYQAHELPRLMAWRTFHGMKLVVEVHIEALNQVCEDEEMRSIAAVQLLQFRTTFRRRSQDAAVAGSMIQSCESENLHVKCDGRPFWLRPLILHSNFPFHGSEMKPSFWYLPPPGNPEYWLRQSLNTMDVWSRTGDTVVISDHES